MLLWPSSQPASVHHVRPAGFSSGAITHFGLGSDSTAPAAGNIALGAELSRPAITRVVSAGPVTTAQFYLSSGTLNGQNIREAGLFIGDTLLARYVFSDVDLQPKTNTVAVVFTWTLTMARL
jgi:hypothetical protein